ncbi:MAG: hypothetical protein RL033_6119, partial [Pseudomonadota bacterium]
REARFGTATTQSAQQLTGDASGLLLRTDCRRIWTH